MNFSRIAPKMPSSLAFWSSDSDSSRSRTSRNCASAPPAPCACAAGSQPSSQEVGQEVGQKVASNEPCRGLNRPGAVPAAPLTAGVPPAPPDPGVPGAGSCQSGGLKRRAALGTRSTESRTSVTRRTLAVMPGISARSGLAVATTTV